MPPRSKANVRRKCIHDPPGTEGGVCRRGAGAVGVRDVLTHRLNRDTPTFRTLESSNTVDRTENPPPPPPPSWYTVRCMESEQVVPHAS